MQVLSRGRGQFSCHFGHPWRTRMLGASEGTLGQGTACFRSYVYVRLLCRYISGSLTSVCGGQSAVTNVIQSSAPQTKARATAGKRRARTSHSGAQQHSRPSRQRGRGRNCRVCRLEGIVTGAHGHHQAWGHPTRGVWRPRARRDGIRVGDRRDRHEGT